MVFRIFPNFERRVEPPGKRDTGETKIRGRVEGGGEGHGIPQTNKFIDELWLLLI
jgi:hypothetical protein